MGESWDLGFVSNGQFTHFFLVRMGFSAEQIVRWVAERTDIHVSTGIYCASNNNYNYQTN